jgi:hypothetical protein
VARAVAARDDGRFWKVEGDVGGWLASWAGRTEIAWLLGLAALAALLAGTAVRRRAWTDAALRAAAVELALLALAALLVRWLVFAPGTGNLRAHLPDPRLPPHEMPLFGPGYEAWIRAWFRLGGADDATAFLAGAVAGALTVVPAYVIAWVSSGRRAVGIAAGVVLAVLPLHARLSPTDDPASLIGLLVVSAVALVLLADRTRSAALLVAAWLAAGLAAAVRPEPALATLAVAAVVLTLPAARRLQVRPRVLLPSLLAAGAGILSAAFAAARALGDASPGALDLGATAWRRLLWSGSVLLPPQTALPLALLALLGLVAAAKHTRGRTVPWLLAGLLPAIPTAALARPDLVTARYQIALLPIAAVCAGFGAIWLGDRVLERRPNARATLVLIGPFAALAFLMLQTTPRPPEPTFRLEYAFFRRHLALVPAGCRIVRPRWEGDRGLEPPAHLSGILGLGHVWLPPSPPPDPEDGCLAFWKPSSCAAVPAGRLEDARRAAGPDCELIESTYRLVPLAEALLPARTGFTESYVVDPVPVGFYRLEARVQRPEGR